VLKNLRNTKVFDSFGLSASWTTVVVQQPFLVVRVSSFNAATT
jgi:hypothetical protein